MSLAVDTSADPVDQRWRALSTATVSDALDRLGIATQVPGLRPYSGPPRVCGRASTLRYAPIGPAGGTVGDFIDDVPPGAVIAIDNAGRTDVTVWGDLLSVVADKRGLGGTVIDGTFRDLDAVDAIGYPIFARHVWMRTGKDRVALVERDGPISLGGVAVLPGDLLLGDRSGVLVVPRDEENRVLDVAVAIDEAEDRIRTDVLGGARLDAARAHHGYHRLQSRSTSEGN